MPCEMDPSRHIDANRQRLGCSRTSDIDIFGLIQNPALDTTPSEILVPAGHS
jgi:hypothetical protein